MYKMVTHTLLSTILQSVCVTNGTFELTGYRYCPHFKSQDFSFYQSSRAIYEINGDTESC